MSVNKEEMELDSIFNFGKYAGSTVDSVIELNSKYISWLVENDIVQFSHEIMETLAEKKII